MLSGVSVSCFLLSYLVVLLMEMARVFFRMPGKQALLVGMLVAGLFAHSVFLGNQFWGVEDAQAQILSNWFQWSVIAAWFLAVAYLVLVIRKPQSALGIFFIPLILGLIGVGQLMRDGSPFRSVGSQGIWRSIHGVSLLVGTMFICLGAAFGVMYLIQANRLKAKKPRRGKIKLPALEYLRTMNRMSLLSTTGALAVGLLSGVFLNVDGEGQVEWFSSGVIVSFALFAWSLFASGLQLFSKGSVGGRRGAYLVIANFFFLVLVLAVVMFTAHGQGQQQISPTTPGQEASL
ncbi:MAG: hypothetical protein AAGG44_05905 [Planctomycetota bacterium]